MLDRMVWKVKKIAWGLTGAGHFLADCCALISRTPGVDLFLSRAAEDVLRIYRLASRLDQPNISVVREGLPSSPVIGRLFNGVYRGLVIAPATSNSVAKFVAGISDTLITNLFAQAGKARVPIAVLPTDLENVVVSSGPKGPVKVYPRQVDLENVRRLRQFDGVRVVHSPEELEKVVASWRERPAP